MKKFLSMILILSMTLVFFTSCNSTSESTEATEHEHTFLEATCKSPKICQECGETQGEKLTKHNISEGKCVDCQLDLYDELVKVLKKHKVTFYDEEFQNRFGVPGLYIDFRDDHIAVCHFLCDDSAILLTMYKSDFKSYEYSFSWSPAILSTHRIKGSFDATKCPSDNAFVIKESTLNSTSIGTAEVRVAISDFLNRLLIPLLKESGTNLTIADYGFVNY